MTKGKTILAPGGMALRFAAGARVEPGAPAPSAPSAPPAQQASSSSSALSRLDEPKQRTLTALTDISARSFITRKENKVYSALDMMNLR